MDFSSCKLVGTSGVQCMVTVKGWYYDLVNVSISSTYSDGRVSDWGKFSYAVLATPPIVPQSIWSQVAYS